MQGKFPYGSLEQIVSAIEPGMLLALPQDEAGVPMAAVRTLVRRSVRDLHLLCAPASGMPADLLIGAGCVSTVEAGGIFVGEIGIGLRFREAILRGTIRMKDSTCPAIYAGLQAGEKGAPFAAVRGLLGSDVLKHRADWRVIDNPFKSGGDSVVLVPAINPDVSFFHAGWGDAFGNVWVGGRRNIVFTAHASRRTVVTVEEIWDGNLLADQNMAPGTISSEYISAIAHVPRGGWPMCLPGFYDEDWPHIREYMELSRTDEGFEIYLAKHVHSEKAATR
jgi:glutaconate CoA-transferase subunit A